jgi:hypothetical protein
MANLGMIVLTGWDDTVTESGIEKMVQMAKNDNSVCWSVARSLENTGSSGFPSDEFCQLFVTEVMAAKRLLPIVIHIHGDWMRDIAAGDWNGFLSSETNKKLLIIADRVQLVLHGHPVFHSKEFVENTKQVQSEYAFQLILEMEKPDSVDVISLWDDGVNVVPCFKPLTGGGTVTPRHEHVQNRMVGFCVDSGFFEVIQKAKRFTDPNWFWVESNPGVGDELFDLDSCEAFVRDVKKKYGVVVSPVVAGDEDDKATFSNSPHEMNYPTNSQQPKLFPKFLERLQRSSEDLGLSNGWEITRPRELIDEVGVTIRRGDYQATFTVEETLDEEVIISKLVFFCRQFILTYQTFTSDHQSQDQLSMYTGLDVVSHHEGYVIVDESDPGERRMCGESMVWGSDVDPGSVFRMQSVAFGCAVEYASGKRWA